jgi:hypothetical protein
MPLNSRTGAASRPFAERRANNFETETMEAVEPLEIGVAAERQPLESIATPLSAERG